MYTFRLKMISSSTPISVSHYIVRFVCIIVKLLFYVVERWKNGINSRYRIVSTLLRSLEQCSVKKYSSNEEEIHCLNLRQEGKMIIKNPYCKYTLLLVDNCRVARMELALSYNHRSGVVVALLRKYRRSLSSNSHFAALEPIFYIASSTF